MRKYKKKSGTCDKFLSQSDKRIYLFWDGYYANKTTE